MENSETKGWVKVRHNFYKKVCVDGALKYHVCGVECEYGQTHVTCPVSGNDLHWNQLIGRVRHRKRWKKGNLVFALLWNWIYDCGARVHASAVSCVCSRHAASTTRSSVFESLLCLMSTYERLTRSYAPYTWCWVENNCTLVVSEITRLSECVVRVYRTLYVRHGSLRAIQFDVLVKCLACVLAEGVLLRQNVLLFARNYLWLSLLPAPQSASFADARKKLLCIFRRSHSCCELSTFLDSDGL